MSLKWDLFWLILKCVAHFSAALYLKDYKLFFFVVCSQILSDNFRFRQNMLAHLSSTLPKIVRFFFKIADESFSVMRDLTLKLQLGLAFFWFRFSFFNQPS